MELIKIQIYSIVIILYIAFVFFRDSKVYKLNVKKRFFPKLIIISFVLLVLDAITAITSNRLDVVPFAVNVVLHGAFNILLVSLIYVFGLYMLRLCGAIPHKNSYKFLLNFPYFVGVILIAVFQPQMSFVQGEKINHSVGISVTLCYVMVVVYILLISAIIAKHWKYLEAHKKISMVTFLAMLAGSGIIQFIFPEFFMTSIGVTVVVLALYVNLDSPYYWQLMRHDNEAIAAFSDLIENRDSSTGEHIKRTSMYVELIASELRRRGMYHDILTNDYITNLISATPMHDIGKVAISDTILQKPGKLTPDEFEQMKDHSTAGGKIIKKTFSNLGTPEFREMAYTLAVSHHEKWNGKGYPYGLSGEDIPLGARIVAIADVFDAVSEDRVYRPALPLDECFKIIENGSGSDFEPLLVDCFLSAKDRIIAIRGESSHDKEYTPEYPFKP